MVSYRTEYALLSPSAIPTIVVTWRSTEELIGALNRQRLPKNVSVMHKFARKRNGGPDSVYERNRKGIERELKRNASYVCGLGLSVSFPFTSHIRSGDSFYRR
jgi:hypothetical protein